MESIYTEIALYGSSNLCARTVSNCMFSCWRLIALMSTARQTDRKIDRMIERQTGRATYIQTDRQTDRHTDSTLSLAKTGLFHNCWASPAAVGQILSKIILSYPPAFLQQEGPPISEKIQI